MKVVSKVPKTLSLQFLDTRFEELYMRRKHDNLHPYLPWFWTESTPSTVPSKWVPHVFEKRNKSIETLWTHRKDMNRTLLRISLGLVRSYSPFLDGEVLHWVTTGFEMTPGVDVWTVLPVPLSITPSLSLPYNKQKFSGCQIHPLETEFSFTTSPFYPDLTSSDHFLRDSVVRSPRHPGNDQGVPWTQLLWTQDSWSSGSRVSEG